MVVPRAPAFLAALFLSAALTFAAEPTGRILGTVTDAAHKPVTGAQVRLTSHVEAGLLRVTSTDERGQYHFKDLPSGTYEVLIEADGTPPILKKGVDVKAPFQNIVDVTLGGQVAGNKLPGIAALPAPQAPAEGAAAAAAPPPPPPAPVTVRGKLSDAAKQPVVDVTVLLVALEGGRLYQASSSDDGTFTIEGVIPGSYRAIIRSPGHVPVDLKSVDVLPESGLDVTLALVDFPLNFKKGELSPPPELPHTLSQPGAPAVPATQQAPEMPLPPPSSAPPAAPPATETTPIEKTPPAAAKPPASPPASPPKGSPPPPASPSSPPPSHEPAAGK